MITAVEIDDVSSIGVIRDMPPHMLPPEAWSQGENVRFLDDSVARMEGETQVFGTPGVAPYFAMYVASAAQPWWLYTSLAKAYVYDGSSHTDITRAVGGDYAATGAADWNGTLLGGIPILNNGIDVPQYWASYATGTKLAALTNWPGTLRAKAIRAFGPYLLALNTTLAGTNSPHNFRWSHPADPGTVPSTWDITDETHDAGSDDLPDVDSGLIVDGLPLAGQFYIYKESSVWRVRPVGGRFIFDPKPLFETSGALCTRCVGIIPGEQKEQHIVVSQDDIFLHDGNQPTLLLSKKFKRYLFNQIDVTNYKNSFVFVNRDKEEAWFCYPASGATVANRALVLNYRTGKFTEADVDFQAAAAGIVQTSDTETWATASGGWDTDSAPWSTSSRRKTVVLRPTVTKFMQLDLGTNRDTTPFTGTVQRTGLSVVGRKRTGEWIEDFQSRKLVTRIWPKMTGGPVNIRLGSQDVPNGTVTWSAPVSFDPSTDKWADIVVEGVSIAVEFSAQVAWTLDGYKLDMSVNGGF